MGAASQKAIAEAVRDSAAAGPYAAAVMPAVVSAAVTSSSLGGLLNRLFGYTYDSRETVYLYEPTDYPIIGSASAGGTATSQIVITQDSDFLCSKMTVLSGDAGATANDVRLQFIFTNTDRQWASSQGGVHGVAIGGTGQLPYILPKPWLISRNSRINITMTSITANARSIYIDFHGVRVADVNALDLTTRR